jgi:hypothetical protein
MGANAFIAAYRAQAGGRIGGTGQGVWRTAASAVMALQCAGAAGGEASALP